MEVFALKDGCFKDHFAIIVLVNERENMTEKLNVLLQEAREQLSALYGVRLFKLVLFGSQARGDSDPSSDIDLMIVLQGPVDIGREIAKAGELTASLSLKHNAAISCVFVSSDRYLKEQSPLLLNVRREGVTV